MKALGPTWLGVPTDDSEGSGGTPSGEAVEVFESALRDAKQFATGPWWDSW